MKRVLFMMTCLVLGVGLAMAQVKKVTGVVISSEDGEPIIGASVIVSGTTVGSITDINGEFTIANVPANAKNLMVSYVGMKTKEVAITSGQIQITLNPETEMLEEVVVTAQGLSRKEKSIGYSTQKVDGEKLTIARQTDLGNSMAGKIAGARFYGRSGATFDAGSIVLRGTTSYTNETGSEPIYVVDGTITNKSAVNMDDVESINVLKGAAATALYGSQGGNGAVIITTKKGATGGKGHFEVSHTLQFDTYYNHMQMQHLYGGGDLGNDGSRYADNYDASVDTMSPEFLYGVYNDWKNADGSYYYDFGEDSSWGARFDPNVKMASALYYDPTSSKYGIAEPFVGHLNLRDLFQTGVSNTTNVNFSKSGKDYSSRISFTNVQREGLQPNSDAVRRFLSANTQFKPTDWMRVSLDYKFTYKRNHNAATEGYSTAGNVLYSYIQWGQSFVNLKDYKDYLRPDGSWRAWNIVDPTNLKANFHDNPYGSFDNYNQYATEQWNVFTGDIEINLPLNIKMGGKVMGNMKGYNAEYKYGSGSINFEPYYYESQYHTRDLTLQGRLTWGDHFINERLSVDAALFVEQEDYHYGVLSANTNDGLAVEGLFNLSATNSPVSASNSQTHYKTRSIYGTATVGFDDTYFLDGSIRNDWDSRLPKANNSYLYGSVSASVMLNQFLKKADWINYWKLRASAAQVGSTLGAYATRGAYSVIKGKPNYMYPSATLYNPNIKPSISTEYEVGTEFRLFNNRLWGDINFYTKDTKDQIISLTTPPQTGYGYRQINAGLIRNRGIEVSLGGTPVKTRDFQWNIEANLGKNTNKLIELDGKMESFTMDGNSFYDFWYLKSEVGKAIGNITTMRRWARNEDGQLIFQKTTSNYYGGGWAPTYDTTEKEVGNFQPDLTGGFSTSFRFKNFSLGASFDFQVGGQLVSWSNMWSTGSGTTTATTQLNNNGINEREPVSKGGGVHITGVDKDGNPVDGYMRAYAYYHYKAYYDLDAWVYDRSYVKMRELSLGYEFSKSLLQKANIGLTSASLSFVATNPWLLYTACPNVDPSEAGSNWLEGGQAASSRSFGFTVKLGF